MTLYLEEFINKNKIIPYFNFKYFLLMFDATQKKPLIFRENWHKIYEIQNKLKNNFNEKKFNKYKKLLKKYYFDLTNPENWIICAFDFEKCKKDNYESIYKLCNAWDRYIYKEEFGYEKQFKIKPYLPFKENTKISYQRNIL